MNRSRRRMSAGAAVALLVFIILGGLLYLLHHQDHADDQQVPGEQLPIAPAFTLKDGTGAEVALTDSAGTVRVINFWASWSPYAKDELPILATLSKEYRGKVVVLALDRDTTPADGRAFLEGLSDAQGLTFLYDSADSYYKQVDGFAMPETLIVNGAGAIVWRKHGPFTEDELRHELELITGQASSVGTR